MKSYNRSNITEEPIISTQAPACDDVEQFREWQRINRKNNPVIDADKTPADHIRVQVQIKKIIDAETEQRNRFKLRDLK